MADIVAKRLTEAAAFDEVALHVDHDQRGARRFKNKVEGLHLLPGVDAPQNNRDALVVDFRLIVSLPIGYVTRHAEALENRPRLLSPYVEHFSQSFARFFMRVGLPSQIPAYK